MASNLKDTATYVAIKEAKKALVRRLKLPRYLGSEFICTVCGAKLRAFKPIWKSYRRRAAEVGYVYPLSSIETSITKHFHARLAMPPTASAFTHSILTVCSRAFDRQRGCRLVEFAPSSALQKRLRKYPFVQYRSADLFRRSVDDRVDITDMSGYEDNAVDIFLCSHILEHVAQDRQAMHEMFRVLRPGGIAIVMVPIVHGVDETLEDPAITSPELRWKYYGLDDHIRQYGKADFIKRLAAAGFDVNQFDASHFGADAFRRAGIAQDSVCTSPKSRSTSHAADHRQRRCSQSHCSGCSRTQPSTTAVIACMVPWMSIRPSASRGGSIGLGELAPEAVAVGQPHHAHAVDRRIRSGGRAAQSADWPCSGGRRT